MRYCLKERRRSHPPRAGSPVRKVEICTSVRAQFVIRGSSLLNLAWSKIVHEVHGLSFHGELRGPNKLLRMLTSFHNSHEPSRKFQRSQRSTSKKVVAPARCLTPTGSTFPAIMTKNICLPLFVGYASRIRCASHTCHASVSDPQLKEVRVYTTYV